MIINDKEIKTIFYLPLLYGKEYLEASLKAVEPFCDRMIIVYTPEGSQGARTPVQCPESEQELKDIALSVSDKVEWHSALFYRECDHREYILQHTDGFDVLITNDADEVFEPLDLVKAIEYAYNSKARHINVKGFINFWKSFNHVCLDGFLPYRFTNLHNSDGQDTVECRIYHFGTCQSDRIVKYKWLVSGHRNEIKQDWFENIYKAWSPENQIADLHVVSFSLWNAIPYDKTTLPKVLKQHPNYDKEGVE